MDDTTHISYTFGTSLVRIIDTVLIPSKLNVEVELEFLDEEMVELALRKIEYWLDNFVSKSIVFSAMNMSAIDMVLDENRAPRVQNFLMITPDEPTDDHLAMIFQSKLQALADGALAIGMIKISSDNSAGLSFTYVGDSEEELPSMEEWIRGDNWFREPWWCRNDASMIDTIAPEGSDLTEIPAWALSLDFLGQEVARPEAIIINADFEPTIIDDDDGPQ